jgi:hypothetical protein
MKRLLCVTVLFIFTGFVLLYVSISFAEAGNQGELQALATFQDGTIIKISEPQFVYEWVRSSDTRYINPPIKQDKTVNLWIQETNHGVTARSEVLQGDIEKIEIWTDTPGDTCSLKARVLTRSGKKLTMPTINSIPQDIVKDVPDAIFHSLELTGFVLNGSERNSFQIKLWGSGICPEAKDVVKTVTFSLKP